MSDAGDKLNLKLPIIGLKGAPFTVIVLYFIIVSCV
jgi:hypothetical protein